MPCECRASAEKQPKEAAIWTYVFACSSAGGDLELRLCMFELRRWLASNMDLRFCMFQRSWSYGLTFMHVWAPAVIWIYVSAYRGAGGHMDLRLCMFERQRGLTSNFQRLRSYGLTWMHV